MFRRAGWAKGFYPDDGAQCAWRPVAQRCGWAAVLLLGLAGCAVTDPVPSVRYDGRYAGTRQSDRTDACGIGRLQGTTSARVAGGQLSMPLFGPRTQVTGTVGEDGRVRASGLWPNPTGGFAGMTVFNGQVSDDVLEGTATDFRCHTTVRLRRVASLREHAGKLSRSGRDGP